MANNTTNYNLEKPSQDDFYDVDVFNRNSDIVDTELKRIEEKTENIEVPVTSVNNKTGAVVLSASDVGAETPSEAQAKANIAESNAKKYADQEVLSLAGEGNTKTVKQLDDDKVDKIAGKGLSTEDYTTAEKNKLAGIDTGANKYTHPSTHPATIISIADTGGNFTSGNVEGALAELFTNVSSGKNSIASAITDMGQSASGSDTFSALSGKIRDISNDATAGASDIASGKTAYVNGSKITGNMLTLDHYTAYAPGTGKYLNWEPGMYIDEWGDGKFTLTINDSYLGLASASTSGRISWTLVSSQPVDVTNISFLIAVVDVLDYAKYTSVIFGMERTKKTGKLDESYYGNLILDIGTSFSISSSDTLGLMVMSLDVTSYSGNYYLYAGMKTGNGHLHDGVRFLRIQSIL